jgi:hypothetical protein
MPSIINSDDGVVSGTSGLKTTGGNDGILALQNNGTTNVTVTAAGNVGIGTSSPAGKLHVNTSTGYNAIFQTSGTTVRVNYLNDAASANVSAAYRATDFAWQKGDGAEVARIDSSGNVGIGTTSPSFKLDVVGNAKVGNVYGTGLTVTVAGNSITYPTDNTLAFNTNSTERARIDSSGNFMVGRSDTGFTSGQPGMLVLPTQGITFTKTNSPNLGACMYLHRTFGAGTGNLVEFAYDTVVRGSISTNGTGVTYGTASDYRLKENVQPMTGALAKVSALKPCTYKWKVDGSDGEGFIAHELAEVVPEAVSGEKDAVNEDGSIKPQGIDTSFLVATLTAAIQELKAELDATKAEVALLKGAS